MNYGLTKRDHIISPLMSTSLTQECGDTLMNKARWRGGRGAYWFC